MKAILIGLMLCTQSAVFAQTFTEKISKELTFDKKGENTLIVANINGSVKVTGYEGDKILIELTRTIKGKTEERLEKGKREVQLGIQDLADTLILFTDGLCSQFGRAGKKNSGNWNGSHGGWGYQWNNHDNKECRETYDYTFDYVIRVPRTINIAISTVNNGDVEVQNVLGSVKTNNVNGSIRITGVERETVAHTINGDVDITYTKNPVQPCKFYTLNGDINAWFQKGLAAELSFESFNGNFFTNVPKLESMPIEVEKKQTDNGMKYKVNGNRFKVGTGGVRLDFETFNGNVYLKETTN
jgi:DUF4097 and DUF4098 domain-containing protein YvlB